MSTQVVQTSRVPNNLRARRTFGRIKKIIDIPNLIEIQRRSYEEFLQKDVTPEQRKDQGLQAVFKSVFPIKDFNETASLEFVSYTLGEPKYDVDECHQRGMTFAAPLKVTIQLVIWDVDPESGVRSIKNVKEQEVYFGEIPLMTRNGTFMINGTERVIVSQLHRSPGVFFDHDKGKTHASGRLLYSGRIIPYRGSWIDFEFDARDILFVRIDRRRKFHATVLLRALGMSAEDLLNYYYKTDTILLDGRKAAKVFKPDQLAGVKATRDVRHPQSNEIIVKEGRKFTKAAIRQMEAAGVEQVPVRREDILEVVRYLIELKNGNGTIDDIDHLGNRRVRAVGELVENQYRIGLVRMERAIKERMSLQDIETLMPQELINYKPVSAVIKEFFGSSQLSQFMDQTNPLSEITHKRRLSALGPGGLTR